MSDLDEFETNAVHADQEGVDVETDISDWLGVVGELLHIEPRITAHGDEIKCRVPSIDDAGTHSAYFDAPQCDALSEAFAAIAKHIRGGQ